MTMFRLNGVPANVRVLPILQSASGSIASFNTDLTENLVEVKCQIVAKQASGTPSPDNERPIITYNQLNLAHIGNTDKMSWLQGVTSGIYGIVDLGTLQYRATTFGLGRGFMSPNIPNAIAVVGQSGKNNAICSKYTLVANGELNSATIDKVFALGAYWTGGANLYIIDSAYSTPEALKTALSGVYLIYELETPTFPTTYTASDFNAMLADFGIDGSLHNIPFGQTVANGVLDITTGKLRVTHGVLTLDGTENIVIVGTGANRRFRVGDSIDYNAMPLSSHFIEAGSNSQPWGYYRLVTNYLLLMDNNTQMADVTALKTWLANQYSGGTPVQFVYELATPIEIQLDSITLQALLNENNIWCDTNGDTEVKFWMSINKYIGQ